jgi:quercetin dioxygenase-like cupin family protein
MRNKQLSNTVVKLEDIPQENLRPGVTRRVYATDDVMFAYHSLEPGMEKNPHTHENFDQLVYIASGRCNYWVDGHPHEMAAGSLLLVPRGAEHYVEPVGGTCVNIDLFAPPRRDMPGAVAWLDGDGSRADAC